MNTIKRATQRTAWVAIALALALVVGACGSEVAVDEPTVASLPAVTTASDSEATPPEESGVDSPGEVTEADAEAANLRYKQCMTDLGVNEEELFGSTDGSDSGSGFVIDEAEYAAYEAALKECTPILEEVFGAFELSPEDEAAQQDILARHNQCMADNGFAPNEFGGFDIPDGDTAALDAALEACSDIFEELNSGLVEDDG